MAMVMVTSSSCLCFIYNPRFVLIKMSYKPSSVYLKAKSTGYFTVSETFYQHK